eukprot:tig00021043_g17617.t1
MPTLDAPTALRLWRTEFWLYAKTQLGLRMLAAGVGMGALTPWTLGVMRPTTIKPLLDTPNLSEAETRRLMALWNRQHAARTATSLLALGFAISAIQRRQA